jgi:hypothetical protein
LATTTGEDTPEEPDKEQEENKICYGGDVKNYPDEVPGKVVLSFDEKYLPENE